MRTETKPVLRSAQRGAALIIFLTVLVLGLAWYVVGALGKAPRSTGDKDTATGIALQNAKKALLAHVARRAARSDVDAPGELPCPEPLSPAVGSEGIAAGCSDNTATYIGRLPWRTLGIDQVRDADGEPLWYILGSGFRQAPVNFSTQGAIELDGVNNAVVALVIAPGAALNTLHLPASGGCTPVNQQSARYVKPFQPAKFLECGRESVPAPANEAQYTSPEVANPLTNDRIIRITAAEIMEAIAGPVADRLQRQVAPALESWRTGESMTNWGASFLPYASSFSDPATNDLCGDLGAAEGLLPAAASADGTCAAWTTAIASNLLGLSVVGCAPTGTAMRCEFLSLFGGLFSATITATAPNVTGSFRGRIQASSISVDNGGTVQNFTLALNAATGVATTSFDVVFPLLSVATTVTVLIPNLPDAAIMADTRMSWFLNNGWHRSFTYYAVSGSAVSGPTCAAGNPGCLLEVRGSPLSAGAHDDKRFVLVLAGDALTGQTRACPSASCGSLANFLEEHNASAGDAVYRADFRVANPAVEVPPLTPPYPPFNDRAAACPLQFSGFPAICN